MNSTHRTASSSISPHHAASLRACILTRSPLTRSPAHKRNNPASRSTCSTLQSSSKLSYTVSQPMLARLPGRSALSLARTVSLTMSIVVFFLPRPISLQSSPGPMAAIESSFILSACHCRENLYLNATQRKSVWYKDRTHTSWTSSALDASTSQPSSHTPKPSSSADRALPFFASLLVERRD